MIKILSFLIFMFVGMAQEIAISQSVDRLEILPKSQIFIDKTGKLSKEEVQKREFQPVNREIISLGFMPNSALWIKFKLKNISNQKIVKILEYANPLTEKITLFDGNISIQEGTWQIPESRESINPTFKITLMPNEQRVFLIRASSEISTIIAQLILWDRESFKRKDTLQKVLIVIFFTIITTLLIYNLFIYLFIKERAYLYYILYLVAMLINESTYSGVAQLYLLSQSETIFVTKYIMILVAFLIVTIIQFTREFLDTAEFERLDRALKWSIYFVVILSLLSCDNFLFNSNIIVLFLPIGGLIIFAGFYTLSQGVKEAKFYVIGWSIVLIALIATNLQTLGFLPINENIKYLNDFAFSAEAFLFSIALAYRIKVTNEKLINLQKEEQARLEKLVTLKTKELRASLQKEQLLYRELNHRVKNNFQMILSLIKLQILNSNESKIRSNLTTIKDRIDSIANLYEMLQIQKSEELSTKEYFQRIVSNIQQSFSSDVKVEYMIDTDLPIDKLIYSGLILNELVTNSFKYAFGSGSGVITIRLYRESEKIHFVVSDSGRGYQKRRDGSLGLLIVETLVKQQLFGKIEIISSSNGVKSSIEWAD